MNHLAINFRVAILKEKSDPLFVTRSLLMKISDDIDIITLSETYQLKVCKKMDRAKSTYYAKFSVTNICRYYYELFTIDFSFDIHFFVSLHINSYQPGISETVEIEITTSVLLVHSYILICFDAVVSMLPLLHKVRFLFVNFFCYFFRMNLQFLRKNFYIKNTVTNMVRQRKWTCSIRLSTDKHQRLCYGFVSGADCLISIENIISFIHVYFSQ